MIGRSEDRSSPYQLTREDMQGIRYSLQRIAEALEFFVEERRKENAEIKVACETYWMTNERKPLPDPKTLMDTRSSEAEQ